ncbi:hypothetical protein HY967_00810 [Candidatus Jorgensenbacteria bacterium]|nr:hypothetical protein [Candidatus Jorgensenbacteria bacterium]
MERGDIKNKSLFESKEPIPVPLDQNIFETLDVVVRNISDEEQRKHLGAVLLAVKRDAFQYTNTLLDELIRNPKESSPPISLKKEVGADPKNKFYHPKDIYFSFSLLRTNLKMAGFKPLWGDELTVSADPIKAYATLYALKQAILYQKSIQAKEQPSQALQKAQLVDVVAPDYIENNILKKFLALPPELRDNVLRLGKS